MIKRYAVGDYGISATECESGKWVKYEDYHNLARMYEHLLEQYNKQEDRILDLSYKAYPARNGSGE